MSYNSKYTGLDVETILDNISPWASASSKPSYTWGDISGKPTTVEGYGITDINNYAPKLDGTGATGDWGISISGNAATATKLLTARTIWGQSFNGTDNVDGDFIQTKEGSYGGAYSDNSFYIYNRATSDVLGRAGVLRWAFNQYSVFKRLDILGENGDTMTTIASFLDNGNVGIGTISPSHKLDVNGTIQGTNLKSSNICIECDADGNRGGRSSEINNFNDNIYIQQKANGNVLLVGGGGNVGIGTTSAQYRLHVNGSFYASGGIFEGNATNDSDGNPINTTYLKKEPTAASSAEYIYAKDADGNPILISKADLASVVAAQMGVTMFFTGTIIGTSSSDNAQIAKDIIGSLPYNECTFSVQHKYAGQRHVYGYVYGSKAYGSVTIQKYEGSSTIVDIDNGVYTVRT